MSFLEQYRYANKNNNICIQKLIILILLIFLQKNISFELISPNKDCSSLALGRERGRGRKRIRRPLHRDIKGKKEISLRLRSTTSPHHKSFVTHFKPHIYGIELQPYKSTQKIAFPKSHKCINRDVHKIENVSPQTDQSVQLCVAL